MKSIGKKAQLGETMTWVVATIVIFILSVSFIFISGLLGTGGRFVSFFSGEIGTDILDSENSDRATQEMLFSLLSVEFDENKRMIDLLEEGNNNIVTSRLGAELDKWEARGVNCDFEISGVTTLSTSGDKKGEEAVLYYTEDKYVRLEC